MAIYDVYRIVDTTTTSSDYELLTDALVKASISERLSLTSDEYDTLITTTGIGNLDIQILGSGFNVSINGGIYQSLLDDSIWSTGDFIRRRITSIRVSADATPLQFRFAIL